MWPVSCLQLLLHTFWVSANMIKCWKKFSLKLVRNCNSVTCCRYTISPRPDSPGHAESETWCARKYHVGPLETKHTSYLCRPGNEKREIATEKRRSSNGKIESNSVYCIYRAICYRMIDGDAFCRKHNSRDLMDFFTAPWKWMSPQFQGERSVTVPHLGRKKVINWNEHNKCGIKIIKQ